MPNPAFELFKDKKGNHRFRLKAANGEIIAASQGYSSKQGAKKGIDSIKKNSKKAEISEEGKDGIKIFQIGSQALDGVTASLVLISYAIALLAIGLAVL